MSMHIGDIYLLGLSTLVKPPANLDMDKII